MLLKKLMATSTLWPRAASVRERTSEADATGVPFLHFYCHPHSRVGDQAHQALPFWKPLFLRLSPPYSVSSYCCSVAKCPTLYDSMDCSTPGFSVLYYLLKFAQIRIELMMLSNHLILCCPLLLLSPEPLLMPFILPIMHKLIS